MVIGVLIDFFATVIPNTGFKSFAINIGASPPIMSGIIIGIFVWLLFLVSIFIRLMEKASMFYFIITLIKVLWFIDIILFMYGVYNI
jgi:hypothetical protein